MPPSQLGNRDLMRAINRSVILNTIKMRGPIARAEVARMTGLSPATVTGITAELIEENLIFEKEPGDSSGGRRPILLAINPKGAFVVGIKLMEDKLVGALIDLEATVLLRGEEILPAHTPEAAVEAIARLVGGMLLQADISQQRLLGVGIGLAGIIDSERGILRDSPFFNWINLPLRDLVQNAVEVPVFIDNDVNTLTLAERWFGCGQDIDNFLVVTIGRGIGMGIVVNGQFYRGAGGGAGEFGHVVMDARGPLCKCGKRGCLETFVADPALLEVAAAAYRQGSLPQAVDSVCELSNLADDGVTAAQQVFERAGTILGQAISNLVNIFNPARIIISGEGVCYGKWLFDPLRAAVKAYSLPGSFKDLDLRIEPWGDDAWARGAASLVLRELYESPVHGEKAVSEG